MIESAPDPYPLVTLALEQQIERLALVRSIRRETTGLGPRAFSRLIKLLETLTSESFSDGTETAVRVKVLAKVLNCDRSTIFRSLADAKRLGIVSSQERFGSVEQQISSVRIVNWSVVRLLADQETILKPTATPPSQLRRPRRNCDAPVATATPYITDNPDTTDKELRSGIPDQRNLLDDSQCVHVQADEIAERALKVFERLKYFGDDGWIFWTAIAAIEAGILSPADVGRSVEACTCTSGTKGPGYFRKVLAQKAGCTLQSLGTRLKTVRIVWGNRDPGKRPVIERRPVAVSAVPRDSGPSVNDRRNAIIAALEAEL